MPKTCWPPTLTAGNSDEMPSNPVKRIASQCLTTLLFIAPPLAALADQVAGHFVLGLLCIAAATALWWGAHDPARVLWITVAVLVITCPCALSLATPAALAAAASGLARAGLR